MFLESYTQFHFQITRSISIICCEGYNNFIVSGGVEVKEGKSSCENAKGLISFVDDNLSEGFNLYVEVKGS